MHSCDRITRMIEYFIIYSDRATRMIEFLIIYCYRLIVVVITVSDILLRLKSIDGKYNNQESFFRRNLLIM